MNLKKNDTIKIYLFIINTSFIMFLKITKIYKCLYIIYIFDL